MISCYIIGEISTVEIVCEYVNSHPLTFSSGYSCQAPENFHAIFSIRPDIVFIDSSMLANSEAWLSRVQQFSYVVIVAENHSKAFEAFEYLAFDFLIKPLPYSRFMTCINKFNHISEMAHPLQIDEKQGFADYFFIKADAKGLKELLIKFSDLVYIKALQNYVMLYMMNGEQYVCYNTLKDMEDSLPETNFSRVHKSFIINDAKISSIEGNTIFLTGEQEVKILIGSTFKKAFFDKKSQRMIRKKPTLQIFQYSKIATSWAFYLAIGLEFINNLGIELIP